MVTALALVVLRQELIGEISKSEFLDLVRAAGYTAKDIASQHGAIVSDGKTNATIWLTEAAGGTGKVHSIHMVSEFDLPRTLSQEELAEWQKTANLQGGYPKTYLGGRLELRGKIVDTETQRGNIKKVIGEYISDVRILGDFIAKRGGKLDSDRYGVGTVPLKVNNRITVIDMRDMEYLRGKANWGETTGAGGHGWITGAHPLGVPVFFSGQFGGPGLRLTWMGHVSNKAHRDQIERETRGWTSSYFEGTHVHLTQGVDTSKGITAGQIIRRVEDFAREIRRLGLGSR